jgi:hypothetical protein
MKYSIRPSTIIIAVCAANLAITGLEAAQPKPRNDPEWSAEEKKAAKAFVSRKDVQNLIKQADINNLAESYTVADLPALNHMLAEARAVVKTGTALADNDLLVIGFACYAARDSNPQFKAKLDSLEDVSKLVGYCEVMRAALEKKEELSSAKRPAPAKEKRSRTDDRVINAIARAILQDLEDDADE